MKLMYLGHQLTFSLNVLPFFCVIAFLNALHLVNWCSFIVDSLLEIDGGLVGLYSK